MPGAIGTQEVDARITKILQEGHLVPFHVKLRVQWAGARGCASRHRSLVVSRREVLLYASCKRVETRLSA
eukprot:11169315-Lingulodinium_polyedra.AAC.1